MKYTLFTLLLYISLSISGISAQQTYPIYVTPSLTPPYSLILSDYSQIGSQRLVVTIQVRDVTVTNLPVRLSLKIENMTGITIETIPTAPVTPIFLSGGEVSVLFGDDMRDYFNLNNLQFKGFSKDEYRRTGQLPEGLYRFTVEVRHFQTGRLISNQGTAIAWIALGKPPMLKTPDNNAQLGQITGMPLTFSWVPSPVAIPGVATQYTFEMWEMRVPGIPPAVVAASMPVFYSTTQMNTLLVIPPATLMLEPGMNYAWRVTASDVTGQVPFAQNGQSEVRSFIYQCRCDSVTGFNVERRGQDVTYRWMPTENNSSFNVEVENPVSGWSRSDRVFDAKYEFNSDPDKTYRARVQAICQSNEQNPSDFTAWQTVNIPAIKTSVEICPDCECGDAVPEPPITNFNLRYDLQPGDTVQTPSGDVIFIIQSVIPQGNSVYKGKCLFWVKIWGLKIPCDYWDLTVNTDNHIVDYDFENIDDPSLLVDVDAAKEYVNQVADAVATLTTNTTIRDTIQVNVPLEGAYTNEKGELVTAKDTSNNINETAQLLSDTPNGTPIQGNNGDTSAVSEDGKQRDNNTTNNISDTTNNNAKEEIKKEEKEFKLTNLTATDLSKPNRVAKAGEILYYLNTKTISKEKRNTQFEITINPKLTATEIEKERIQWTYNTAHLEENDGKTKIEQNIVEQDDANVSVKAGYPTLNEKSVDVKWINENRTVKDLSLKIKGFFDLFKTVNKISDAAAIVPGARCEVNFLEKIDRDLTFQWQSYNKEDGISRHILKYDEFTFKIKAPNIASLECGPKLSISAFGYKMELGKLYIKFSAGANIGIVSKDIYYYESNKFKEKQTSAIGGIEAKGEAGIEIGGGLKDDKGELIIGAYGGGKVSITGGGRLEYPYNNNTNQIRAVLYIDPLMYNFTAEVKMGPLSKKFTYSEVLWNIRIENERIIDFNKNE